MERVESSPQAGTEQSGISSDEGKHRARLYAGRIRRGKAPAPPAPEGEKEGNGNAEENSNRYSTDDAEGESTASAESTGR